MVPLSLGDRPPQHQWPLGSVLGVVLAGLVVVALGWFRLGTALVALALLLGLVLRATLTPVEAGWLAVRARYLDMLMLLGLGAGLLVVAVIVPAA